MRAHDYPELQGVLALAHLLTIGMHLDALRDEEDEQTKSTPWDCMCEAYPLRGQVR